VRLVQTCDGRAVKRAAQTAVVATILPSGRRLEEPRAMSATCGLVLQTVMAWPACIPSSASSHRAHSVYATPISFPTRLPAAKHTSACRSPKLCLQVRNSGRCHRLGATAGGSDANRRGSRRSAHLGTNSLAMFSTYPHSEVLKESRMVSTR
jgi:hypothetical protein